MRLYYFTNSFPFGLGEQWKEQELNILSKYFEEITIVPFHSAGNLNNPRTLGGNIQSINPLFESEPGAISYKKAFALFVQFPITIAKEFFQKRVFFKKDRFVKALLFMSTALDIKRHKVFKSIIKRTDKDTFWLFYWGRGSSDVIPFLPVIAFKKLAVRIHRYDVFEYANNGYIPFRDAFYNKVDEIYSVSAYGKKYVSELYPQYSKKIKIGRLGTCSLGKANISNDGTLRIVTCSALVPVKRIDILITALRFVKDLQIEWRHIGGGELLEEIKLLCTSLPCNIAVIFTGPVHPTQVIPTLLSSPVDLFINVSESEGVPVSIMEALSAGIPVMATDVGGTGELIDGKVGKLLSKDILPHQLAKEIQSFLSLPTSKLVEFRENAYERYEKCCNMRSQTQTFLKDLLN